MAEAFGVGFFVALAQYLFHMGPRCIVIAASLRIFDMRSKIGYVLAALTCFTVQHVLFAVADGESWCILIVNQLSILLPLLIFSRDSWPRRAFASLAILVAVAIAEIPSRVYWDVATGGAIYSLSAVSQYPENRLATCVIYAVGLAVLCTCVLVAEKRITPQRTDKAVFLFGGFLFTQLVLVTFLVAVVRDAGGFTGWLAPCALVSVGALVAVDAAYFYMMGSFNHSSRGRHLAMLLQQELEMYLENYEEIEREVSLAARVRHDMRNQAGIILMLIEQGDVDAARRHLDALIAYVEQTGVRPTRASIRHFREIEHRPVDESGRETAWLPWAARSGQLGVASLFHEKTHLLWILFPMSQAFVIVLLLQCAAGASWSSLLVVWSCLAIMLCFVVDAVLLRPLIEASEAYLVDERIRLLQEQKVIQRQYYERLRAEVEEAQGLRFGMISQLSELEAMILRGEVEEASAKLRSAIDSAEGLGRTFCEHRVVNAMLEMKAKACLENEIDFECNAFIPSTLEISDVDACAVFSNLLDNAIAGCKKAETSKKRISIRARVSSGVLAVSVENSCSKEFATQEPSLPIGGIEASGPEMLPWAGKDVSRSVEYSLSREHGWGLHILRSIAEIYNGSFETSVIEGPLFRASIMLVLDDQSRS